MYIEILDECRIIVPYDEFKHLISDTETCSIDRRKAFSKSASDIAKVPVFQKFDIWKPCGDNLMLRELEMTLCIWLRLVRVTSFSPKFNLVYGKHLKQLIGRGVVVKILF